MGEKSNGVGLRTARNTSLFSTVREKVLFKKYGKLIENIPLAFLQVFAILPQEPTTT